MIENACAVICFIYSAACAVLTWFYMAEREVGAMYLVTVFGLVIMLVAGYVLVTRHIL